MKQVTQSVFLIMAVAFISCSDNSSDKAQVPGPWTLPQSNVKYDSGVFASGQKIDTASITNATINQPSAPTVNQQVTAAANNATVDTAALLLSKGLNPPHGSPGHRCDLQVGAPLNSKPQPKAEEKTKPGLNPAHGQPGHRCDIAVGAPLDSKPVKPATIQNTTVPTDSTKSTSN